MPAGHEKWDRGHEKWELRRVRTKRYVTRDLARDSKTSQLVGRHHAIDGRPWWWQSNSCGCVALRCVALRLCMADLQQQATSSLEKRGDSSNSLSLSIYLSLSLSLSLFLYLYLTLFMRQHQTASKLVNFLAMMRQRWKGYVPWLLKSRHTVWLISFYFWRKKMTMGYSLLSVTVQKQINAWCR